MAGVDLPNALGLGFWDKHKSVLAKLPKAPATKLGDELKKLGSLHHGIDWAALSPDKVESAEAAADRAEALEAAARGGLKNLAAQAQVVEASAAKFETEAKKDKAFPKEPLAAAGAIAKAARDFKSGVDDYVTLTRKAIASRAATLAAAAKGKKDAPAGSAGAAAGAADVALTKLVKARLLDTLRKVRAPKPGARPVRFLAVVGKTQVAAATAIMVGPAQDKQLRQLLANDTPLKTIRDPAGEVIWEKNALTFVSDVLPGGAIKKLQLWLRKALKLNIKLRARRTNGEVEETEGEDISDELLKADPADQALAAQDFQRRLDALQDAIKAAVAQPGSPVKALMARLPALAKAGQYDDATDLLDEIEAALETGSVPEAPPAKPTAAAASGPSAPAASAADAMNLWKERRAAATGTLKAVAGRIAAAKHPASARAIIELQAVIKNITAEPASLQQVTELQRWLSTDDVVNDVCDLTGDFRSPLLGALNGLRSAMAR